MKSFSYTKSIPSLVILLLYLLQVRSLAEYLSCKLRVGDNLPVAVVLQGTGTDIQPLTHFLSREEKFACKEWLVCLCHFHNPLSHTSQSRGEQQGSIGNNKEKGNPHHRFAFAFSCPVFFCCKDNASECRGKFTYPLPSAACLMQN